MGEKETPKTKQPNPHPFGSKGVVRVEVDRTQGGPMEPGSPSPKEIFFGSPGPNKKREIFLLDIYIQKLRLPSF